MYVANSGSDFVSVIDPSSNTVIDTITVGSNPGRCGFRPGEPSDLRRHFWTRHCRTDTRTQGRPLT
jgi:YVTN family beta-propeller protein